jgi:hypothetical protein
MTDAEFQEANNTFEYMYQKLRKEGRRQIRDNKVVQKGEVHKLYRNMLFSSRVCKTSNTMDATSRAGTAYPSEAHERTPAFSGVTVPR